MQRILKCALAAAALLATAAQASSISVSISVVDSYDNTQTIDWQGGWSSISLYATGPDGTIYYPERGQEGEVFVFPEAGIYTFDGQGHYVCGLVSDQKKEIKVDTTTVTLLGWCE